MTEPAIPRGTYLFGTIPGQTPEFSALRQILDKVLVDSSLSRDDALTYALAWLAAVRLMSAGAIPGYREYSDLLLRPCWEAAERSGLLPSEVISLAWAANGNGRVPDLVRLKLLGLLADFVDRFDLQECDVTDAVAEIRSAEAGSYDSGLCDAIVSLLNAPPGSTVWVPFDETGQITIRALKQGLKVVLDGPGRSRWSTQIIRLLALIEGKLDALSTDTVLHRIADSEADRPFDFLIACPPIGIKVRSDRQWRQWEGKALGLAGSDAIYQPGNDQRCVQLDRSDPWAMAALFPHVKRRAIFMSGLNLLFAKGQEQRLREFLVLGLQQPSLVAMLPPKLLSHSGIPVALTVFDRTSTLASVRLIDAGAMTIESKSTMQFTRHLDSAELIRAAQCRTETGTKSVPFDVVAAHECNLLPARYLKALAGDLNRVALGDLIEMVIRAPVISQDTTATEAQEIGIADLTRWEALHGPFAKSTPVRVKKLPKHTLLPGDIIISIKGSIGKVGLVGTDIKTTAPIVCSQSVMAMRPKKSVIGAHALYLYLRSDDFKAQLEAFRAGTAVAHVTPATLLRDVKVPKTSLLDQAEAEKTYLEICGLELQAERAYQRLEDIRSRL
jgi:hypothetical protein